MKKIIYLHRRAKVLGKKSAAFCLFLCVFASAQVELGDYDPSLIVYKDLVSNLEEVAARGATAEKKGNPWDVAELRDPKRQDALARFGWELEMAICMMDVPAVALSKYGVNLINESYQIKLDEHPELVTLFNVVYMYFFRLKDHQKDHLRARGLSNDDIALIAKYQRENPYRLGLISAIVDWNVANIEGTERIARTMSAQDASIAQRYAVHQLKHSFDYAIASGFLDLFEVDKQNTLIAYSVESGLGTIGWSANVVQNGDQAYRHKADVLSGEYLQSLHKMKADAQDSYRLSEERNEN